ncbi:MAG TPA: dihydroorotate dehydrogenase-like protein, partial [Ilumatobacteraceae bacterium]|nr:dihydroorotate dehydrogenase-like protein [Ilumatobacteraceae bacterium]
AAIVLPSLFEAEVIHEETQLNAALEYGAGTSAEADDYFPDEIWADYASPIERYLNHLQAVRAAVEVPVIASLNAVHPGSWMSLAKELESAGASALELNLYHVATDHRRSGTDVEHSDAQMVAAVCTSVNIPVAVKMSPYYSSLANIAGRFVEAGAAGLVCFNRFYQPDIDVDTRQVAPHLELSSPWELRLPLSWIAMLRPLLPTTSLAATTGIGTGRDAAKALLVGADVTMMTAALLRHGPGHVAVVERELRDWAESHEYDSVAQLRGSVSRANTENPEAFERANYYKILHSFSTPA